MGMIVQHNMNALNAYNKLNSNVAGLKKSSEKLSSGYRINRAGDDAAGLAISEKMRSQIRGISQAIRNSQDGINMIQTFEGAAQETHSILQRMKELASESANGTYDNSTDRDAIELEFKQLNDELKQIADTDFNGRVALNGGIMADGTSAKKTAKPADVGETESQPTTQDVLYSALKQTAKANLYTEGANYGKLKSVSVAGNELTASTDGKIDYNQSVSIDGFTGTTITSGTAITTNADGSIKAGTLEVSAQIDVQALESKKTIFTEAAGTASVNVDWKVTINGIDYYAATGTLAGGDWYTEDGVKTKLTEVLSREGLAVAADTSGDSVADGKLGIKLTYDLAKFTPGGDDKVSVPDAFGNGRRNLTYASTVTLQAGSRSKDAVEFTFKYDTNGIGNLNADMDISARGLGTDQLTLATPEDANYAIDQIDNAINKTSMVRATFGAIQNRLEHKINNLTVNNENLTEAESNIRDTDMASEMMNYTKFNILQQAAQSMLAQANQQPQSILQLLG